MSNSNGIISSPINVETDVYKVLGITATSNGYDVGYACGNSHGKINMWSRFKPVRWRNDFGINLTNSKWWKGEDGTCGITVPSSISSYRDIPGAYTSDLQNGWTYSPPNGTLYPYRLLDFDGYKHDAKPPFSDFGLNEKVASGGTLQASMSFMITSTDETVPGSVRLEDISATGTGGSLENITNLGQYYFGIVVTDLNGTVKGRVAGNEGVKYQCSFSVNGLTQGTTYKAYPFLSDQIMSQSSSDFVAKCYTLPGIAPKTFQVTSSEVASGLVITLMAEYVYTGNARTSIKFNFTIRNNGTGNVTLINNYIMFRFMSSGVNDAVQVGEKQDKLLNITVNKGDSYMDAGEFTIPYNYQDRQYYVYLSLNSGQYTKKIVPMMQAVDPF